MATRKRWPGPAVGKPTKGKKSTISVRVPDRLKAKLNNEAARNDRPLSQEAEYELEAYHDRQRIVFDALDLAYGTEAAGLMFLLGELAVDVQGRGQLKNPRSLSDPWTFGELVKALQIELERIKPPGVIEPPAPGSTAAATWPEFERELIENYGANAANAVHRGIFETRREREAPIRERLFWVDGDAP